MKMQKPKPTSSQWMEDSFHFEETDGDEDDDVCFETVDSVSAYTPGDTDTDVSGPYSVTSCPPSVGPDQDAFLPTPHKMYAPTSPAYVTPPSFLNSRLHHPTDDDHHVSSVQKMLQLRDQVTRWQAGPDQTNVDSGRISFEREHAQKSGFARLDNDVSRTVSDMDNPKPSSLLDESPGIRRTATCSSFEELENDHRKQSVHEESPDERRMSLDEFIVSLNKEDLLATLQDESQTSLGRNGSLQMVEASNTFMNEAAKSRNVKTPEQPKSTNRVRKRTAQELIFSNPDFSCSHNEIPVKRQMVVAGQTDLMPHFTDGHIYNPDSIVDEMCGRVGLAPNVHTPASKKERSASASQNLVNSFLTGSNASPRHSSLSDTGQFGQALQEPHISSLAPTTSTIFNIDHNGNVVDSKPTGSHSNSWVVERETNHSQHLAFSARTEEPRLQIQQHTMSSITSTQPDTALACVQLENLPGHLHMAASSTTNHPYQIIYKLPDYHLSTLRSTDLQNDSNNQNLKIANQNRLPQQETASIQHTSRNGLVYQDLQTSIIRHPDVGVCNREATTLATTTTSRHDAFCFNDICQRQEMGRKSHLFNPSAGTDPFPASIDPIPASTDPLLDPTDLLPGDGNQSDILRLPVDAITAQMLTTSSTDNTSLYQTLTFSNTTSELQINEANYTHVVTASEDLVESLPGNSRFNTTSTSVFGYHHTDILADPQECNNTDPGTSYWESCTPDELIQARSGVVESNNSWNVHARATEINYETQPDFTAADLVGDTVSAADSYEFICPSLCGNTSANDDTDYLYATHIDDFSTSRSSYDPSQFSATDSQNPVFDAFLDAVSRDSATTFACNAERNVVSDTSSVAYSANSTVDLAGVTDSALVGARRKSAETAQKSDMVKQGLKHAILIKRQKEGKEDIDMSYQPKEEQHELNEEEQEQVVRRKELNRVAAAVHRQKKKTSKETQDKEFDDLMKTHSQLKKKVAQIESEKEHFIKLLQGLGYQFHRAVEGPLTVVLPP